MKILIVTTELGNDGGGMAYSCNRLVETLSANHEVLIAMSNDYPITVAKRNHRKDLYDAIRKECKLKEETDEYKNVDVVIGFGGRFNGYYASLLAEKIKARFILSLRGSDINIVKWNIEDCWYTTETCKKASQIVCLSNEMRENILSLCPSANGKIILIPNEHQGIYHDVCFPNLPNRIVLGTAATHLNEKKGIANMFKMLVEFKKINNIPITLVLVGKIDNELYDEYKQLINYYNIAGNVIFKGYMNRAELHTEMHNWDFYIQGSIAEGHPNSIIECLQNGTAFIESNTGYIAELLNKVVPELQFNSLVPQKMAQKINSLLNVKDKNPLYKKAFEAIEAQSSVSCHKNDWENLLTGTTQIKSFKEINHIVSVGLHDVQGILHDSITTPTTVFKQFVEFISNKGYGLCSMNKYLSMDKNDRKGWIVCTFDDGYKGLVENAEPILSAYGFDATVFICTGLIGLDNTWNNKDATLRRHLDENDLKTLIGKNWEIASHGVTHRNLLKLSDLEIEYELSTSKEYLESLQGYSDSYAYPYGAYNKFIQHSVSKYFKYAFAVSQGGTSLTADSYQLRRYSISEIYQMLEEL